MWLLLSFVYMCVHQTIQRLFNAASTGRHLGTMKSTHTNPHIFFWKDWKLGAPYSMAQCPHEGTAGALQKGEPALPEVPGVGAVVALGPFPPRGAWLGSNPRSSAKEPLV